MKRTQFIGAILAMGIISLVAPLSWAGQRPAGEMRSAGQSVVLIAQLPGTASVAGFVSPVPQTLLEDGQTGELVILKQSWTLGRGETLDAQAQVVTEPDATAQLFGAEPQPLLNSFVASSVESSRVQTFPLVTDFDPAKGSLTDTRILLVVHNRPGDTSSASVRVTVVAL